jgi:hypothetical protein
MLTEDKKLGRGGEFLREGRGGGGAKVDDNFYSLLPPTPYSLLLSQPTFDRVEITRVHFLNRNVD